MPSERAPVTGPAPSPEQARALYEALAALAEYRILHERLPGLVRAAVEAGASKSLVARTSGMSRKWVGNQFRKEENR